MQNLEQSFGVSINNFHVYHSVVEGHLSKNKYQREDYIKLFLRDADFELICSMFRGCIHHLSLNKFDIMKCINF